MWEKVGPPVPARGFSFSTISILRDHSRPLSLKGWNGSRAFTCTTRATCSQARSNRIKMANKPRLSRTLTEEQFDNGYWYADELKSFARDLGIKRASTMRKDQLENAVRTWLRSGAIQGNSNAPKRYGTRDFKLGLQLDLPVANYTSNQATKDFIVEEARKIDPGFTPKSGTRYLLNRWREDQMAEGRKLTYGDLVQQWITLNQTKSGPLRLEHGRYMNFISDFMAANPGAGHADAVRAWAEVKRVDGRKTYETWKNSKLGPRQ